MNKHYPHPILAREGWPFIFGAVAISSIVCYFFWWASIPLWLLTIFVIQFFRDPARPISNQPNVVLSPCDGRVIIVEEAYDPYAQRQALKISVFMNVFNVHSNRIPIDGVVKEITYFPGKFVNADLDKASLENERNAMIIETDKQQIITAVQVAGLVARRILCYVKPLDKVSRGERYGFIRFGSRVDVFLPLSAKPLVSIGDKVSATTSVLARFD